MVVKTGAKRVVLDSVNLFLMLFDTDPERRRAMFALSKMLTDLGCTSLLTCEVKENTNSLSWYGFEEFVVDGVIVLYSMREKSAFLQGIAVRKMRMVKHRRNIVPYEITDKGLIVYPTQPFLV
jgi:KaiC/GvpD/RAD55 family RecA-like ATPase